MSNVYFDVSYDSIFIGHEDHDLFNAEKKYLIVFHDKIDWSFNKQKLGNCIKKTISLPIMLSKDQFLTLHRWLYITCAIINGWHLHSRRNPS